MTARRILTSSALTYASSSSSSLLATRSFQRCTCAALMVASRSYSSSTFTSSFNAPSSPSSHLNLLPSLHFTPRRTMFIRHLTTPNANSLKFLPGRDVSPAGSYDFSSYRDAVKQSPLAALLFSIDGVRSVYLGNDFISINIEEGKDWDLVRPEVYACIMDFYASGKPVILESTGEDGAPVSSTTILPTDSEVVAMIKELIETRIRPAVQEDGGDIDYKSFDEATGKVLVQMQGSCKGCSSSAITLKNGIENMLMHYVPEVKSVEEFVDEEVQSVSEEALKKLEEKLEQVKPIPTASPV